MSPTWTMRLYASPKRALRPTLRKHRARQPQSNRTKTGRRLESGGRPDLVPLLFVGVGVFWCSEAPRLGPSSRPIHRSAWNRNSAKFACKEFSQAATVFSDPPMWERDIPDTRRRTVPPPLELRPAFFFVLAASGLF